MDDGKVIADGAVREVFEAAEQLGLVLPQAWRLGRDLRIEPPPLTPNEFTERLAAKMERVETGDR